MTTKQQSIIHQLNNIRHELRRCAIEVSNENLPAVAEDLRHISEAVLEKQQLLNKAFTQENK